MTQKHCAALRSDLDGAARLLLRLDLPPCFGGVGDDNEEQRSREQPTPETEGRNYTNMTIVEWLVHTFVWLRVVWKEQRVHARTPGPASRRLAVLVVQSDYAARRQSTRVKT